MGAGTAESPNSILIPAQGNGTTNEQDFSIKSQTIFELYSLYCLFNWIPIPIPKGITKGFSCIFQNTKSADVAH
jgi:hypothetical protein